jgi:hypothetical protein
MSEGFTVLQVGMTLMALALVVGGAIWFWAWRHERQHRDEGPLQRPPTPRPPRPPSEPPPSAPLGP